MTSALVDTNIIIDVLSAHSVQRDWSVEKLIALRSAGRLVINPVIFAELAPAMPAAEADRALSAVHIDKENITFEIAWRAGLAHAAYRRAGGVRDRTLPDFLIGAHAAHADYVLLTRDPARYRTYFPELRIIAPDTNA